MTEDIFVDCDWEIVNDTVMGGVSESAITRTERGTWLFTGDVSLANNGGFASVQAHIDAIDLSAFSGLRLRVRGDGNRYGLNLRSPGMVRVSYRKKFATVAGHWTEIDVPFAQLEPVSFGNRVSDAPPLDFADIQMVGVIITDKQEGNFALEIGWIRGYA